MVVPMLVGVFRRNGTAIDPAREVVPMLVGVFRSFPQQSGLGFRTLSPCSWGCSARKLPGAAIASRCPHARGGVPAIRPTCAESLRSCPHARGGVPWADPNCTSRYMALSPCSWGCSAFTTGNRQSRQCVVPMLVGVFRIFTSPNKITFNICPHARGGVPVKI